MSSSSTFEMVTPQRVKKLDKDRAKGGHYLPAPTTANLYAMYTQLKSWWSLRDILIRTYLSMAMLESPFSEDKNGLEAGGLNLEDNETVFDVSTFPFDSASQAIAMLAESHPYTKSRAAAKGHTDTKLEDYDKFIQGIIDTRMEQSNLISESLGSLIHTGWLVYFYPFDPGRKARDEFPFPIRQLSPLGVYPDFDADKNVMRVFIERRVRGSQLISDYRNLDGALPPGIAELVDAEPDDDNELTADGTSLYNSQFTVIRYYDDTYTTLFVNASDVSSKATTRNPALAKMVERTRKGKPTSVLMSSDHADNPYYGLWEHKMGCVPMTIKGCWPEPRDRTMYDATGSAGRYMWLPWLYAHLSNWRMISSILSKMHQSMLRAVNSPIMTTDQNANFDGEVIRVESGEDAKYMTPPQMPPEFPQYLAELKGEVDRGTFGPAAYGARAGTSGSQQNANLDAGSVKLDVPRHEIQRGLAGVLKHITKIMIYRGDEELGIGGDGRKYDGSYFSTYSADKLGGVAPTVEVRILKLNGVKDPQNVALYNSLVKSGMPDDYAMEMALDEPNPMKLILRARDLKAMSADVVLQPRVQLEAAKAQLEVGKELSETQWQVSDLNDRMQFEQQKRDIEREVSQMPVQKAMNERNQELQRILTEGMQPPPSPQTPSNAPSPGMPPSGNGGPMPNMPLSPGQSMPPMNMSMPQGVPSQLGSMPPAPMMAPPSMPQRPPLSMPGMPPMNLTRPLLPPPPPGMGQIAKAPGQAQQPIQPLSRMQPMGGVGRPGVPSPLMGAGGLPGGVTPAIARANASVAEPKLPPVTLSARTKTHTRRGRRG